MENKNKKIGLIIILSTVLFLAIIFIGMTYAFFTANNPEGSTAEIKSETGRMLITYNDGTDNIVPVTNIQPSNAILVNKTFTLTGSNTTVGMKTGDGLPMPYKVGVQYTSTFSDGMIHYYIKEMERPANSNVIVNYVITPETGKTEDDYKNQTVPGNETYTGYTHGIFKNGKKYTEMVTGVFPALKTDQTIKFNLIIQFPDNNENQDSEKGKTFNGKVVVNYEAPKPKSFAEDTWETIAKNTSSDVYKVGDTKTVLIGNNSYTVRIANKSTPTKCNESNFSETACGFVVEFVDIVEEIVMNDRTSSLSYSNSENLILNTMENNYNSKQHIEMLVADTTPDVTNKGGWPATTLRTYANGVFFNNLPEDLRNVIKDTKVVSGHGSNDTSNFPSTDKIYLLSGHEVFEDVAPSMTSLSAIDTAYGQTRQLDYYKIKGVNTNSYSDAIKKYNGSASFWWLRAARSLSDDCFWAVGDDGRGSYDFADNSSGFAPAFRIG